jgi:ankyrin repeat protein
MPSYSNENSRNATNTSTTVLQDGGKTDIWRAAEMGDLKLVQSLLKTGEANQLTKRKKTPLHYAVTGGHLTVVKFLLLKGADKSMQDEFDKTPLDYCKMFSDETKYGTTTTTLLLLLFTTAFCGKHSS